MAMVCPSPRRSVKIESVAWPQLPVTPALRQREPLAQQVEHLPFKQRVVGSSPTRLTNPSSASPDGKENGQIVNAIYNLPALTGPKVWRTIGNSADQVSVHSCPSMGSPSTHT